jgi:hypothetical protein
LKHIENTTDGTLGVLYFGQRVVIQQLLNKMQLTADIKTNLRNIKWILSESIGTRVDIVLPVVCGDLSITLDERYYIV